MLSYRPASPDHYLQCHRSPSRRPLLECKRQKQLSILWSVPVTVNHISRLITERLGSNSCYQINANFLFFFREESKKETARGCLPANMTPQRHGQSLGSNQKSHRPIGFAVVMHRYPPITKLSGSRAAET